MATKAVAARGDERPREGSKEKRRCAEEGKESSDECECDRRTNRHTCGQTN